MMLYNNQFKEKYLVRLINLESHKVYKWEIKEMYF